FSGSALVGITAGFLTSVDGGGASGVRNGSPGNISHVRTPARPADRPRRRPIECFGTSSLLERLWNIRCHLFRFGDRAGYGLRKLQECLLTGLNCVISRTQS